MIYIIMTIDGMRWRRFYHRCKIHVYCTFWHVFFCDTVYITCTVSLPSVFSMTENSRKCCLLTGYWRPKSSHVVGWWRWYVDDDKWPSFRTNRCHMTISTCSCCVRGHIWAFTWFSEWRSIFGPVVSRNHPLAAVTLKYCLPPPSICQRCAFAVQTNCRLDLVPSWCTQHVSHDLVFPMVLYAEPY